MEAVPRMPMLSFELKHSPEPVEFSATLKQVIRDQYHEDPANYNKACLELEQLRQNSVQITHDFIGCSTLKKYYAQLQFLQSRFPLQDGGDPPLVFTWEDVQSGREYSHSDVKFEQACILYNIGALHSLLGAMDTRQSAEGMKVSCTHFQCAAWAFQHLRDHFGSSAMSPDMAHEILSFHSDLMLAQAQECILEKSMTDNRKSSITAKVAVQIAEFYRQALRNLDATNNEGLISSRRYKDWKRRIEIKILFYQTIMYFYLGSQAEEQQKHGERLAYFTAASERLTACSKLAKNDISEIHDSLRFTQDVVGGKFESAKKDNDFVYHEKVPPLDSLPEIKGASLVKGISFNPNDLEVSGPDIFQKLVPFEAHESSSLYSEEKAKLLRTIGEEVESKDAELSQFMASLKLDSGKLRPEPERLPQSLLEKCAAISVRPNAVKDLIDVMGALSGIATEVELGLQELRQSLEEEDKAEEEYQNKFGKRSGTIILPEIRKEMEICQEQHTRGSQSNAELHKAMNTHTANLKLISGPLDALEKALPSTDVAKSPEDEAIVSDLQRIMGKVEEMKSQRVTLHEQLRNEVHKDDITTAIVTHEGTDTQTFFQNQLQKHDKVVGFLRQNMAAQNNVLKALTETNARFANMRKVSSESLALREAKIKELIHSYDVYEDLMAKSQKGLDFYRKLESNVSRLLQRAKGVIKTNNEERDQMLKRYAPKESTPSRPAAPKPSSSPNIPPVPSSQSALPSFDGPKLKDYLPFMKPATFGPKAGAALPPTVPPNIPSAYPTLPSVGPGLSDMSSTSAGYPDVKQLPPGSPQPGHISSSLHTVARPSPTGSPSHVQKPQPPSQLAPRPPQPSAAPPPGSVPTLPEGYSFVENHPTGPAQPSDYQQPRQPQTNPRVRPKLDTTNTVSSVDTPIFSPTKDHADGHAVHTHNLHHAVGTRPQDVPDGQAQNLTQPMQHMNIAANQSYYNQYPGSTQQPDLIQGQRFPVPNGGQSFGQARFTGALSYSGSIPQQNYTTGYEHKRPPPMPPQSSRPLGPQSGARYPAQPATPPAGISYQAQNQGPMMNYQHPQQSMWQGQSTSYAGTTGAAAYRGQAPFQGHQHMGQGQPPSNVHGIAPQQQPASQNYIPQQRSSVAGLSTAYSAQSSQPLSAGFPSSQQPQPGYQASVGSQYQQSQSGQPYPTSSSPNPQGMRQQVPSQQTSQTAQFYGNQTPHSQVQQRPVVPNQQQIVHPSTAQWQQTPTGPFPVQPGQGQQSVAGQQQSVQAGSQQNLAFARQAQQLPVGQQQPMSQGTLGQGQQQALQQNRQGYVQPNQSVHQLHGLPQQQQQQNQMQPGAGQQQGNYQTFSAQPPQQVNSPYQHQQQKQTQTGVSQQQTQQGQGMQQQRTMQYQPQQPGGQIPSAQQPTYHQPIMQNVPQVTGSIQAGYPIVQAQSASQIQPQQGNIPNQSVPQVTGSVRAGYQTLQAQSASQIPPEQGNIPNQTVQRQQQVSAGPVHASAGYGVAGSQPQSLSSQTQLPYQQSQTNFPVQTSIPGSQNYQKQQPQNLTQPFGVGGAPASSQPPQQPVLTAQAGHIPFNQQQQPQFTGIQPHAGQQMQPQHFQSQPISGRQFGTSQPIAGPTQQGPVHQQRQTGQQATFGQGQQGLQSQFNSYQQPNVLSSGQPTQQPQVQNFQQGHQILPQNLPQPTIQPAVVHTASVPAKDAAAPAVTQQSASVPFNIQSPTSAPANPPNVPVASFSPQAPNSAVSSTVEAGGISGGSQVVQQQQHTTGTTNITQHTPQKPGHLSRQISNSTTSSFDDILSSSPENQRDIPAADSVLTPTVLTAQEIAQQKEEALKLHDQQQQPKDPFSVKETLDKFVAEVEKYEKIVDSLCTPKLSGPSHLVTEWKELCQDQDKIAHQHSMAVARCYVIKNRDPDIMPYDDTRVLLNSGKDDYINASWVNDLAPSCPKFIATQGPLPVTLADFWLMVYEQGTEVIVMLSREDEPGKKMPVYWPTEKGHVTQHGPINLTLQSVKDKQLWLERIIYLTHSETKQGRTIVHLQYLGWPVSGLPEKIPYILQFINEVHYFYKQQRSLLKPVVVHCSNGVGRTGTFLAVYTGMQEINKGNGIIDLPALVAMMRSKRKHMMTDMEHLKFCYEAILYHAQDELMKRGILTNKKSFSDRLPKPGEKTHSRKPSEDFILGTAMGLHALESNVAKFTSKHMHGQSQDAMVTTGRGHESVASVPGQTHIPGIIARDAIMSLDSEILDNSQKSNIQTLPDLIQQQPENVTRTDDAAKTQSNVDMLSGLGGGQSENSGSDSASEGQGQGHVQGHSGISGSSSGTQSLGGSPLNKPKSLSSQSASLPPSLVDLQNPQTFTLDGTTGKKRITKASFSQKGKSLVSDNQSQDPNDPLSGLDPLWTIHKEKNTSSS